MRHAIADAEVGDDQYGEDPSVNRLQAEVAALLGTEAALLLPSGTMANQVALRVLTRPGDDVLVPAEAHILLHETGGAAANAGVQLTQIGERGTFDAQDVIAAAKPAGHIVYPPTTLLVAENTHNRAGGIVFPQHEVETICAAARERNVTSYLDGARLWNAAVASGRRPAELAAPCDVVGVCLSKGLGAPGGSLLAGTRPVIERAVRQRRMLGGAMRQAGILAAAGLYALEHQYERLAEDHANARLIGERLTATGRVRIELDSLVTNIIVFHLAPGAPDAATVVERARERGVLVFAFGARTVRAVTHLNVSCGQCERAADVLAAAVS